MTWFERNPCMHAYAFSFTGHMGPCVAASPPGRPHPPARPQAEHRRAIADVRRPTDQQHRIDALLLEAIAALARLVLDRSKWPC